MSIRDHIIQWARQNEPVSVNEIAEHVQRLFDQQAIAAKHGMDAAKGAASEMLTAAKVMRAECSPEALESERQANAQLTEELGRAEAERNELRRQLDLLIDAACLDGAGPRLRKAIDRLQAGRE
ncbi:MAG: hypothetical protein ACQEUG_15815 [Pseudomonadota bacterium]